PRLKPKNGKIEPPAWGPPSRSEEGLSFRDKDRVPQKLKPAAISNAQNTNHSLSSEEGLNLLFGGGGGDPNTFRSMADPELEAIRQRRMQELMAQHGAGSQQNPDQQKAQEDAKREADERRQMMLSQILSSEARERVARIALVKPEKARGVEDVLLRAAQMGQIVEKVSEERLISMLEQINTQTTKQTKVTIQRRRSVLDDDD
ncbi:hypothetical protein QUC31_012691, partial [Theobroma cacao]